MEYHLFQNYFPWDNDKKSGAANKILADKYIFSGGTDNILGDKYFSGDADKILGDKYTFSGGTCFWGSSGW